MDSSDVVAGGAVVASAVSAVLAWRSARRATNVDQQDADTKRATELRADAQEARQEARAARRDAAGASVMAGEAHRRMEEVVAYLGWIVRTIHDPDMTMDRLRAMVGSSPPPDVRQTRV